MDFGEADFYEAGTLIRKKYLTVSFPYSNDGYSQVFGGETAECVCQGLQDIFEFIGGVPPLLVQRVLPATVFTRRRKQDRR